ncbi:MAG: dUTP diphosphatase [Pseudomonadota bacterium]
MTDLKLQLRAQLDTMAHMQEGHNQEINADWRNAGYPYYRAIWVECAELLDHFGWKWWKLQPGDLDQVRLELVDIWHFGLSDLLRESVDLDTLTDALAELSVPDQPEPEAFRLAVERLAFATLEQRRFVLPEFLEAMRQLPMSAQQLFDLYVGKNVLNSFRQRNGYRSGTYLKNWGGREDNEHLVELLGELNCAPADVPERLSAELDARYRLHRPA